jgi:hypothetical protein
MAHTKLWARTHGIILLLVVCLLLAPIGGYAAPTWTLLKNLAPGGSIQLMVQMTDGTIMVQAYDGHTWMKLTPDAKGSYINGTWTTLATEPIPRLYFASQVMPDGRFVAVGGEYSGPGLLANWSNTGEIYDPVANTWTPITSYPNQAGCPSISYVSGNVTNGSSQITGIYPYTTGLAVGWLLSAAGFAGTPSIVSIDSPTQITVSAAATSTHNATQVSLNHSYQLTGCLGDEPSVLLPDALHGQMLVGDLINNKTFIYNANTDTWAPSGSKIYPTDSSDEEGWAVTTNGSILTYDLFKSVNTPGGFAELYNPTTGAWSSISPSDGTATGTIPVMSSNALGFELGPVLRLQDGRMFVIGANQHTALYDLPSNTWSAGPDIMGSLNGNASPFGADDAPGAIMPNGHVIFAADSGPSGFSSSGNITAGSNIITAIPSTALMVPGWTVSGSGIPSGARISSVDSPSQVHINALATSTITTDTIKWGGLFNPPTQLFDFNPTTNTISALATPIPDGNLPTEPSYPTRMLVLPTGQMLFSDSSSQLYVYTQDGGANPLLRPSVNAITYNNAGLFTLTGLRLNGQSAGASYGDDDQMDSNYPIIRLTDASGNVFYARTSNWSKAGSVDGAASETVNFTLNPGLTTPGNYTLTVSGAGIASFPIAINITAAQIAGH